MYKTNTVGRPKKIDYSTNETYGFFNSKKASKRDSVLSRTKISQGDYKFDNLDVLKKSVIECINDKLNRMPCGIIVKGAEDDSVQLNIDMILSSIVPSDKYRIDPRVNSIAKYICSLFNNSMENYSDRYDVDSVKNYAYHIKLELDMIYYGGNLSVVYQIINDIHYNYFNNHYAFYILTTNVIRTDPLYSIDIYVCNTNNLEKSYLSTVMAYGFDQMKCTVKTITSNIVEKVSTAEGRINIPVFSAEPYSMKPVNLSKPNTYNTYLSWYNEKFNENKDINNYGCNDIITKL